MTVDKIKFGASGWQGVLADDFTVARVKTVTQAIADHIASRGMKDRGVVVGYDTRFMSEFFAEGSAKVLAANGIHVYLSNRETPAPVITFELLRRKTAGSIIISAPHQPPYYHGLQFLPAWGGSAPSEVIKDIETRTNILLEKNAQGVFPSSESRERTVIETVDLRKAYLEDLKRKIDFDLLKKAKLKIALDLHCGTARDYLDTFLTDAGCAVSLFHGNRDPLFSGCLTDLSGKNLASLSDHMKRGKYEIGLAVNDVADQFAILDGDGTYINPNQILALLLDFLCRTRGWKGGAARSIATSHLIDAVAKKYGIEVYETGIGFHFIGDLLMQGKIIFGGEENAGLTIKDHLPERDGILACLLVAEMVATERKPIKDLLKRLYKEVGTILAERAVIPLPETSWKAFAGKLSLPLMEFGGMRVKGKKTTSDGTKYMLEDDSWLLLRFSDTERAVLLYAESSLEEKTNELIKAGSRFVLEG